MSAFFSVGGGRWSQPPGTNSMDRSNSTMARQIAKAASAFEHRRTGHAPKSVSVVVNKDTLVITLREALSPAEMLLAKTQAGITQLQTFHRELFASSSAVLLQEINRITGAEVSEASAEVETVPGAVMKMFTTGTVVQVFLLSHSLPLDAWSGSELDSQ
jgi:uncharacterized protein YbcI